MVFLNKYKPAEQRKQKIGPSENRDYSSEARSGLRRGAGARGRGRRSALTSRARANRAPRSTFELELPRVALPLSPMGAVTLLLHLVC